MSSHPVDKPPKRRRQRALDMVKTLEAYKERLQSLPDECFDELNNAYISCFDVYSTLEWPTEFVPPRMRCNATVLAEEAYGRGVSVLGVTSQRKKKGEFICNMLRPGVGCDVVPRDQVRVIYVGQYSYFTSNKKHAIFSLQRSDKVLMPKETIKPTPPHPPSSSPVCATDTTT